MASTPRLDLNRFYEYDTILDSDSPFNQAVSRIYEPGSVFKVLTMAAALDSGLVTPDTTFTDTGSIEIGGIYIRNWNYGAWGQQTMTGCMQHSLNVCLAWLAREMGPSVFYTYMERFNIGRPTGIDIANEVNGVLRLPGDQNWYEGDLGTNSFGQGVAVSPIQLAMAISSVANGGEMVMPHLMRTVVMNGRPYSTTKSVIGKPISAETAHTLTEMLAVSLEEEASNALVNGYRVAGKTGTAEIATDTGYSSSATNASFVGWGPVDDPQFLVYVWLEKPQSSPWGSVVAAPVFSQVFKELVVLTGLPPDAIRQQLNGD
jgi:cell division protein FtsI/penicillin-binding protein 2